MARSSSSSFLVAATARAALVALAGAVVLLLLLLLPSASAGDWRGRPHRLRTEEEYHFNHVEVPLLTKDKLPESFSWANARGRHLLVRFFFSFFLSQPFLFSLFFVSFFSFQLRHKTKTKKRTMKRINRCHRGTRLVVIFLQKEKRRRRKKERKEEKIRYRRQHTLSLTFFPKKKKNQNHDIFF